MSICKPVTAVCYAAGTRLLTDGGEIAVEKLTVGDLVVTASGAHRPVRWLGSRRVDCARHPEPSAVRPVRIAAGLEWTSDETSPAIKASAARLETPPAVMRLKSS
jgi:hypothetical protein